MATIRDVFLQGLLVVIPIALTFWIVRFMYNVVDGIAGDAVNSLLQATAGFSIPGIGLILMVVLVFIVGLLMRFGGGRWVVNGFRRLMMRIPLVKAIYGPSQQLLDSFTGKSDSGFKRVVLIEYPKAGTWMVGFLTATTEVDGQEMGIVYVATAPTPNSGWVAVVPIDQIYDIDLTVGDAMNLIFSGGIKAPETVNKTSMPEGGAMALETVDKSSA